MDDLQVDLGLMAEFVTALRTSTTLTEQSLNALRDTGRNSVGSVVLDHAADEFQHTWRYGLGKLKDKTSDTADRMSATLDVYRGVEDRLTEALTGLADAVNAAAGR